MTRGSVTGEEAVDHVVQRLSHGFTGELIEHRCSCGARWSADVDSCPVEAEAQGASTSPVPVRDQHFTNPPNEGLHLDADQLASLKVLLDAAVPRETGGPMDWEGVGRRYHESIIGFRAACTCPSRMQDDPAAAGCPVHDPEGSASDG